ncbi:hypothetical protein MKX01_034795 [Papaver californicum]|nr:hypothetical protein MKX01_034795 [Papaver californicum]
MATTTSTTSLTTLHKNAHKTNCYSSPNALAFKRNQLNFSSRCKSANISSSATKYDEFIVDEEVKKIKRLQNGSDVRGVAVEGEKGRTVDLTPPAVEATAESFGEWVINGMRKELGYVKEIVKVSLGRDPRISGASLSVVVFTGLKRTGCSAYDMGLATTPDCFMSTLLLPFDYDASIMKWLKKFTPNGGLRSTEVEEICGNAAGKYANRMAKVSTSVNMAATLTKVDFMSSYAKHLRDIIKERINHPVHFETPLKGFKSVYYYTLQFNPTTSLFIGTNIVTDARTSMALTQFITKRGGHHCLNRVGYRNVIDKGIQLNKDGIETHLMMETSGHGALKENHFLDDGAYMVVKIIIEMVRMKLAGSDKEGIGGLIKELEDPADSAELRINIICEPRFAKQRGIQAIETFRNYIEDGRLEGWELDSCGDCWVSEGCLVDSNDEPADIDANMYRAKVSDDEHGQHGWIHVRQSIHNPNIAVNIQSSIPGGCQTIAKALLEKFLFVSDMDEGLDINQIGKYAESGRIG